MEVLRHSGQMRAACAKFPPKFAQKMAAAKKIGLAFVNNVILYF